MYKGDWQMIKRMMIVDDSPMIHNLLRKTLERNG